MFIKRNSLRYPIKAKGTFKSESGDPKVFEGDVLDLGYLGWSIFLKESVAVNTIIEFDLSADFLAQHLIGKGRIAYVAQLKIANNTGYRIGVEFIEFNKNIVMTFINENIRIVNEERIRRDAARKRQLESKGEFPF